jgi:hypothetical protein
MRTTDINRFTSSLAFIGNIANPFSRPKGSLIDSYRSPFTDPKSGKELGCQSVGSMGFGWTGIASYDREIFRGLGLVTFGVSCGIPRAAWLAGSVVWEKDARAGNGVLAFVSMPSSWQLRVKQALTDSDQRSKLFFKQQGKKALKALQAQPAVSKPAAPVQ